MRLYSSTTFVLPLAAFVACLLNLGHARSVTAATIGGLGLDQNEPGWHSTGVAKPFTVAGSMTYGADGYVIFGADDNTAGNQFGQPWNTNFAASNDNGTTVFQDAAFASGLPSYVSTLVPGANFSSANWGSGYADGDDPRLPAAAAVADTSLGAISGPTNQAVGAQNHLTSFTVAAGAPEQLRVGIMYGNIGDFFTPTAIRITENGGPGTATISSIPVAGSTINWAFFDITDAQAGDVFEVFATVRDRAGSANDRTAIGGITFDTVPQPTPAPEPSTLLLTALALIGVVNCRLRRQRV